MRKNSTLIYLLKDFQPEQTAIRCKLRGKESFLRKAEDGEMVPSKQTIDNILGFAQSYEVIQTKKNGCIEMILN